MKTHPGLLVRDCLAECFVAAARGEPGARAQVQALAHWRREPSLPPALRELCTAGGTPLFEADGGLAAPFAAHEGYVRDRARRYAAALGWICEAEAWSQPLEAARCAWDAGLFFEVHELLEPEWMRAKEPARRVLQGMIMAGGALYHLGSGNRAGARGLLRQAAERLERAPSGSDLDLGRFARALARLGDEIEAGAIRTLDDVSDLPRLERRVHEPR
ncbi:MAG: DUF309 domain-containing protein [Myxococcota bacterium]